MKQLMFLALVIFSQASLADVSDINCVSEDGQFHIFSFEMKIQSNRNLLGDALPEFLERRMGAKVSNLKVPQMALTFIRGDYDCQTDSENRIYCTSSNAKASLGIVARFESNSQLNAYRADTYFDVTNLQLVSSQFTEVGVNLRAKVSGRFEGENVEFELNQSHAKSSTCKL